MSKLLDQFNKSQLKNPPTGGPEIRPGDTVNVHQKIKEGDPSASSGQAKERIQIFKGVVIARKHGKEIASTITVRKAVDGIGVERIFPLNSPAIAKIEIVSSGKARRSKLYYLRTAKGKRAKLKKRNLAEAIAEPTTETINETPSETPKEETANSQENSEQK